jgi:hypothetical protein
MKECVALILGHARSSARHSVKDSTGRQPFKTPWWWSSGAKHASSTPRTSTSQLKPSKPSLFPSLSQSGIDKFTKWPEVEPVRKVTAPSVIKFLKGLVAHFGVPNKIITDNSTQFTSRTFTAYCQELGNKICYASVAHPRSNGQVERANADVLHGLRTRTFDKLHKCGRRWVEELPTVLWSIRMTPSRATGQTPFSLVYGAEAVLPT